MPKDSPKDEVGVRDLQRWLNRNLVSLVLIYWHLDENGNSKGEPHIAACSCFVMSFGDLWFLVSAGHVLLELNELVSHQYVKVVDSFIVDSLGSQATHKNNIPFDYADSPRHFKYEDGLDYGLISLNSNQKRLIQKNGITAVAVQNWIDQDIDRCKGFILIGIPAELVKREDRERPGIKIGTIMSNVKRLKKLPAGVKETKYDRFIGDLVKKSDLSSLKGISGGPILGFFDHEGQLHYWVVALQSHSLRNRYIFGCPVKLFGQLILDEINELLGSDE